MIELRGLTKTYPDGYQALRGVDLELGEGLFGLLGPNGAGKTTLLSILVMMLEPTSGTRSYDGADSRDAAKRAGIRRSIGYLPQDFQPIGHLTGREYLIHCARMRETRMPHRELANRAEQLLEAVALAESAHRPSGQYSGGMRRRLGVAQALIHGPRLLVIDEPTAGLDPEERIRFRNLISEVADHVAVLLSTHICEDIEATCDRVGILTGGRIVFDGAPGLLMQRYEGTETLEEAYGQELARHGSAIGSVA
jgi:ABC-2 type transport system ATP-binding protein